MIKLQWLRLSASPNKRNSINHQKWLESFKMNPAYSRAGSLICKLQIKILIEIFSSFSWITNMWYTQHLRAIAPNHKSSLLVRAFCSPMDQVAKVADNHTPKGRPVLGHWQRPLSTKSADGSVVVGAMRKDCDTYLSLIPWFLLAISPGHIQLKQEHKSQCDGLFTNNAARTNLQPYRQLHQWQLPRVIHVLSQPDSNWHLLLVA